MEDSQELAKKYQQAEVAWYAYLSKHMGHLEGDNYTPPEAVFTRESVLRAAELEAERDHWRNLWWKDATGHDWPVQTHQ